MLFFQSRYVLIILEGSRIMETRPFNISPNYVVNAIGTFRGGLLDSCKEIHAVAVLNNEEIREDENIFEVRDYTHFKVLIVWVDDYYNQDDYERWVSLIKNNLNQ